MDADNFLKILGERIRAIRKSKDLSQEQLAELAGLHPTYISDVERGKVNASIYSCYAIVSALEIPFSDLVSPYVDKKTVELENDFAAMAGLIRKMDKKKRVIVLSAIRCMIAAMDSADI